MMSVISSAATESGSAGAGSPSYSLSCTPETAMALPHTCEQFETLVVSLLPGPLSPRPVRSCQGRMARDSWVDGPISAVTSKANDTRASGNVSHLRCTSCGFQRISGIKKAGEYYLLGRLHWLMSSSYNPKSNAGGPTSWLPLVTEAAPKMRQTSNRQFDLRANSPDRYISLGNFHARFCTIA